MIDAGIAKIFKWQASERSLRFGNGCPALLHALQEGFQILWFHSKQGIRGC